MDVEQVATAGFERGRVRFSRERIEKVRNGKRITSIGRDAISSVSVKNQSASEQPVREWVWAIATAAAGVFVLSTAWRSGEAASWAAGVALLAAAALLVKHQLTTVTVVEFIADGGRTCMDFEERLSQSEIQELNRRLAQDLGWPVDRSGGGAPG